MDKQEPELPFDRCIHCNAVLGWPGVALPRIERLVFDTIYQAMVSVPTSKHLARMLDTSHGNVRSMISRINKKLHPKGLKIIAAPLRVVRFSELKEDPATPIPGRLK